jgi:hypothetical protein
LGGFGPGDDARMESFRVIVANEPRSYRNVMFRAFECLRPAVAVVEIEPEDLDGELSRCEAPCLVVCSRLSAAVEKKAVSWVELYPEGQTLANLSILGARFEKTDMRLSDLLSAIDQTLFSLGSRKGAGSEKSLI